MCRILFKNNLNEFYRKKLPLKGIKNMYIKVKLNAVNILSFHFLSKYILFRLNKSLSLKRRTIYAE